METLDAIVTYTLDLVLGGSAFYLGASLTLYLVERWKELEPKSKVEAPQAINIPLQLKASVAEAIPLEAELQEVRSMEAMPAMPSMPVAPPLPETRPLDPSPLAATELQLAEKPEPIEPTVLPELQLSDKPSADPTASEPPAPIEPVGTLPELQLPQPTAASKSSASEPAPLPEPFSQLSEPIYAEDSVEDISSENADSETEAN